MKLLWLSGQYPPRTKGGGEISTHLTAAGLVAVGHEVTVVTQGFDGKFLEREMDGVRVWEIPADLTSKPLLERRAALAAAEVIRRDVLSRDEFDVWHAHDFRTALVLAEAGVKKSVVTARDFAQISGSTNHFWGSGHVAESEFNWRSLFNDHRVAEAAGLRKMGRFLQYVLNVRYRQRVFADYDAQIFISRAQLSEIKTYQSLENQMTEVIYNPVQTEFLAMPPVVGQEDTVLYVGRVEMYKGVGVLLEAWGKVLKERPQARLRIVGEGAQKESYEQLVRRNGWGTSVEFESYRDWDQIQSLYDEARVVVAPHLWMEPFGRTVAEAMGRGKVVVASGSGGPGELIEDGVSGVLCEPGSVDDLAKGLLYGLGDEALGMGDRARLWAQGYLAVSVIAGQYAAFYARMLHTD